MNMDGKTTTFRPSKLDPWQVDVAERVRKLMKERSTLSQKDFASRYGLGSGSMMTQYLQGKRAIGLEAAIKFAKGLGVPLEAISVELAQKLPPQTPSLSPPGETIGAGARHASDRVTKWPATDKRPNSRLEAAIALLRAMPPEAQADAIGFIEYTASKLPEQSKASAA